MKPETEMAVMKAHFEKSKKEAVTCLRAMGAELPEGMAKFVGYVETGSQG